MCGISGIIAFDNSIDVNSSVIGMNNAIRHRGPDDEGYALFNDTQIYTAWGNDTPPEVKSTPHPFSPKIHVHDTGNAQMAFGHRRLSIIDLSPTGHQPMCDQSKRYWITYNGEIYNYPEIRKELQVKGHNFITQSDTEVIIEAYKEWGEACLDKFNGMWSFVLFDLQTSILFASRDRFGVKPFYYIFNRQYLAFASEQKALLQLPFFDRSVNSKAVFDLFVKGETEYEETGLFENIIELQPSCAFTLNIKSKEFRKWKYYATSINEDIADFNDERFAQYAKTTKEKLKEAVAMRLRSDVQVGFCLSGGIDSSAIVCLSKELLNEQKFNVFTASFHEKNMDESPWAEQVAEHTHSKWHRTFPVENELQTDLEQLVYSQDIPIWSTSTYAQHRVMKLARDTGIKVVLDGQGGDELFAGYDTYLVARWNEMLTKAHYLSFIKDVSSQQGAGFYLKQDLRLNKINKLPVALQSFFYKNYYDDIRYLNKDLWQQHKGRLKNTHLDCSLLNKMLYSEFYNTRLKTYLKCEDRCSMWHSVESRTPFADDRPLIEFAFSVPGIYKMNGSWNKTLLREGLKGTVPDTILNRKDKMGYQTPNNKWITGLKDHFRDYFTNSLSQYIDVKKLLKEYDTFFSVSNKPENGRIFKFVTFAVWHKLFFNK